MFGAIAQRVFAGFNRETEVGEKWEITDFPAFARATFHVSDPNITGNKTSSLQAIGLKQGDVLVYAGSGSGNKRMYKPAAGHAFDRVEIHMNFKADGAPETFGLKRYVDPANKLLNKGGLENNL